MTVSVLSVILYHTSFRFARGKWKKRSSEPFKADTGDSGGRARGMRHEVWFQYVAPQNWSDYRQLYDGFHEHFRGSIFKREENHIMENILYNDLIRCGFDVDVGVVEYNTRDEDEKNTQTAWSGFCHQPRKSAILYSVSAYDWRPGQTQTRNRIPDTDSRFLQKNRCCKGQHWTVARWYQEATSSAQWLVERCSSANKVWSDTLPLRMWCGKLRQCNCENCLWGISGQESNKEQRNGLKMCLRLFLCSLYRYWADGKL